MAKYKYIKRQDCAFKLEAGKSGETSINLSQEIKDYLVGSEVGKGAEIPVSFQIFKEDFVNAICYITNRLPLYVSTSKECEKITDKVGIFSSLSKKVESFFGESKSKVYECTLLYREDGRVYLNGLRVEKFSIRDFLVEDNSVLSFEKGADGQVALHILMGVTEADPLPEDVQYEEHCILSDENLCRFAYKCIHYFSEMPQWSNIERYVATKDFDLGDSIKIFKKDAFALTGMFKCTTEDNVINLNTPRRRWFTEPFEIFGKTVFLSTEWYPSTKADGSAYQLMLPDLGKFITECFGKEYEYRNNGKVQELWQKSIVKQTEVKIETMSTPFKIENIIAALQSTGLIYTEELVKRYVYSLMTKPFVILSGLAGSGKTQLAIAFAHVMSENIADQVCIVPVGADWTNREPLLGYPNALQENKYVMPESGALQIIMRAVANPSKPYFLILDEMNLSYVERYFADFLSAIESHEQIPLWTEEGQDVPTSIVLPKNLFIVGTINVDETTYMFSPKVLDRASVIEFKIDETEMASFLGAAPSVDIAKANSAACGMGADFVTKAKEKGTVENTADTNETLLAFFKQLKTVNAEFGYRSATEIARFIGICTNNGMEQKEAVDAAIVQKLLPKLHGSRKKLVPVLKELWTLSLPTGAICLDDAVAVPETALYPLTADKILRMYRSAVENGFTSFAEA